MDEPQRAREAHPDRAPPDRRAQDARGTEPGLWRQPRARPPDRGARVREAAEGDDAPRRREAAASRRLTPGSPVEQSPDRLLASFHSRSRSGSNDDSAHAKHGSTEKAAFGSSRDTGSRPARPALPLVICHGVNSHGGQYIRPAEAFADPSFAVTALDLRQAAASRKASRFYADSIDDYVVTTMSQTIELAQEARHPDLAAFTCSAAVPASESMSASYAADDYQERIDGLICESFRFQGRSTRDYRRWQIAGQARATGCQHAHVHASSRTEDRSLRDPETPRLTCTSDPADAPMTVQPVEIVAAARPGPTRTAGSRAIRTEHRSRLLHPARRRGPKRHGPIGSQQFSDEAGSKAKTLKLYEAHISTSSPMTSAATRSLAGASISCGRCSACRRHATGRDAGRHLKAPRA